MNAQVASETSLIPLSKLHRSIYNARKKHGGNVADIAASIQAHGVLQNLTVHPTADGYGVAAGDRRRRALELLRDNGVIQPDHLVSCQIVDEKTAAEISAAENVIREAMHPADEFDAFNALAAEGMPPVEIAARFGCEELHVKQRLKLANVVPDLVALYREDQATLQQLMALAITDDHAEQVRVWDAAKADWQRTPEKLRAALTMKEMSLESNPIAKYIGAKAYESAGEQVRGDLFGGENSGYLLDPKLARRLAEEKLQKRADQLVKDGWSWAEARIEFGYEDERKFQREYQKYVNGKPTWPDAVKAYAGCVVSIDREGKCDVTYGLVKPGDRKKSPNAKTGKKKQGAAKQPGDLPFAVVQRLQGVRTAALRMEVSSNQRVALAALAAALHNGGGSASDLDGVVRIGPQRDYHDRPARPVKEAIEQSIAHKKLEGATEAIEAQPPGDKTVVEWLLSQPIEATLQMLTHYAASAILVADKDKPALVDHGVRFADLAGVDLSLHWSVTTDWIAGLQKSTVVAIVREACGDVIGAKASKLRGTELADYAADVLQGVGWLPTPLRGAGYQLRKATNFIQTSGDADALKQSNGKRFKAVKTPAKTAAKKAGKKMTAKTASKAPAKAPAKKPTKKPAKKAAKAAPKRGAK